MWFTIEMAEKENVIPDIMRKSSKMPLPKMLSQGGFDSPKPVDYALKRRGKNDTSTTKGLKRDFLVTKGVKRDTSPLSPISGVKRSQRADLKEIQKPSSGCSPLSTQTNFGTPSRVLKKPDTSSIGPKYQNTYSQQPSLSTPLRHLKKSVTMTPPARVAVENPSGTPTSARVARTPVSMSSAAKRHLPGCLTPSRIANKPVHMTPPSRVPIDPSTPKATPRETSSRTAYSAVVMTPPSRVRIDPNAPKVTPYKTPSRVVVKLKTVTPASRVPVTRTLTGTSTSTQFTEPLTPREMEPIFNMMKESSPTIEGVETVSPSEYRSPDMPFLSPVKRRKKDLTWAQILGNCSDNENIAQGSTIVEIPAYKDGIFQSPEGADIGDHDEMQDNSSWEKTTSSPAVTSHNSSSTTLTSCSLSMQLPLSVLGPGTNSLQGNIEKESQIRHEEEKNKNGNKCRQISDIPGTNALTVTQHLETSPLCPDSLSLSQPQLGQDSSESLANIAQNELLQKQIKLYEEKTLELAKLESQIETLVNNKGHQAPNNNGNQVTDSLQRRTSNVTWDTKYEPPCNASRDNSVANSEYMKQNVTREFVSTSQGYPYSDIEIDVNSNMTVKSPETDTNKGDRLGLVEGLETSPELHCRQTLDFGTPTSHRLPSVDNAGDQLRNPRLQYTGLDKMADSTVMDHFTTCKTELHEKTSSHFDSGNKSEVRKDVTSVIAPIMTPLALRSVAKRATIESPTKECEKIQPNVNKNSVNENQSILSEGLVPSETHVASTMNINDANPQVSYLSNLPCLKTPPSAKRQSAFRRMGKSSGLSPVVGSLSLRANSDANMSSTYGTGPRTGHKTCLRKELLEKSNERYFEALLDSEVELYTCRLATEHAVDNVRCFNPVAGILLHGDDMHFIPIDEIHGTLPVGEVIQGSAFTKVIAERSS